MRTKKATFALLVAMLIAFTTTFALAACQLTTPKDDVTLSSIAVTTQPTHTEYTVGENFDPAGMVVTATYSDESKKEVRNYTYAPDGELALTDTVITVSYTEKDITRTTEIAITVSEGAAPITLESIEIGGTVKTEYTVGDSFDPTGMTVTAKYSDESSQEVNDYTCSPEILGLEDDTVTVTYTENDITVSATVTVVVNGFENPDLTENGEFVFEEDRATINGCSVADEAGTTNGKALGSFQPDATVIFRLNSNEAAQGKLYFRLATGMDNRPADLTLGQNYQVSINDTQLSASETPLNGALGWGNYFEYFVADVQIIPGTNVIEIAYLGVCPHNFDNIKLVLGDALFKTDVKKDGTYVFEEDRMTYNGCSANDEAGTANGKALGGFNFAGITVDLTFTASEATSGLLYLRLATGMGNRPADLTLGQNYKVTVNGTELPASTTALNGALGWSNYFEYLVGEISVVEGENTIHIEYLGVCAHNFDNLKLVLGEDATQCDINGDGTYVFEEDRMNYNGFSLNTEDGTINGKALGGTVAGGSGTITLTFTSKTATSGKLYLRLATGMDNRASDLTLGQNYKVTVNGTELPASTTALDGTLGWANYFDYLVGNIELLEGENTIQIEYLGACPHNFDNLKIVTGAAQA